MKVGISVLVFLLVINTGLVKGSCPSVCSCSSPWQELIVDCRSRSLGNIPADLLNDTYHLTLNENNISHIEEHAFGTFTSLYELNLESNPLNCDCTIYPFWSWLVERANTEFRIYCERDSATCSNGTLVKSLQVAALTKCNPDNFQCFNGGKPVTRSNGHVVCECIGNWTGNFCQGVYLVFFEAAKKSQNNAYKCVRFNMAIAT
ncbi:unnamed protein product [Mytilus coruscus]|uniref:EGF-like domain-containing protein n=1 Tax=Mytilus coruscus TaxID=42192 RepID=A0A6J8DYU4_MYTCO|nr:unnamed protein product [Mytilus coruscus]